MNDRLLELLFTYGVVVLGPILFLSAIGVPLPGTILIVAAGAFASGGQLSFPLLLATAIVATLLGNGVGYWIGRRGGEAATTRWARRFHVSHDNIERAQSLFTRYGGLSVLFTRFPLSPLSAIVNIVAGAARYSIRTFVVLNLIGVTVWASVYAGLGYAFGASWESISNLLNNITQVLTLVVIVAFLAYLLVRTLRDRQRRRDAEATHPQAAPSEEEEQLKV